MADQLAPGRPCPVCVDWWWLKSAFTNCFTCDNHRRMPYEVDVRGQKMPGGIWHVPSDFDFKYDKILTDPPDNRSPMIKMLDQRENP